MSFIVLYCVAFASLTFVADMSVVENADMSVAENADKSFQYLNKLDKATKSHKDDLTFLQKMMKVDFLWWPILNEMVNVSVPNEMYFDHYTEPGTRGYTEKRVLPFGEIVTLMKTNTFTGSDVRFVMNVLKSAMACSVLKHISLQGIMLYALLTKSRDEIPESERTLFKKWLENMVEVAIDKLTALDHSQDPLLPITRVRKLLVDMRNKVFSIMVNQSNINRLQEIGLAMYAEMEKTCAVPDGDEGHYAVLIDGLNKNHRVEEMKIHRTHITDNIREVSEVHDVEIMLKYKSNISIEKGITANDITEFIIDILKKASVANHIQMNFLYLNLPIQTLTDSQWISISQKNKYRMDVV